MMRAGVVIAMVVAASAAYADRPKLDPKAFAHLKRGKELYDIGEYHAAIDELEAGFKIDADRTFLYAIGQAYRMLGDCPHATESFEAFLATNPPDTDQTDARLNIKQCGRKRVATSGATLTDPWPTAEPPRSTTSPNRERPAVSPARPVPAPAETIERPAPAWYRDVTGDVLAAGGIVGLAVGATYLIKANHDVGAANSATSIVQLQHLADTAHHERTIGTIATIAGTGLAVGAIIRYVIVGRRGPEIIVAVDRTGGSAAWTARF